MSEDQGGSERKNAEDQQGQAPPGSGSQKDKGSDGWKPPSDGSWLPKVRVDEMVSDLKGQLARQAEEVKALKDAQAKQAEPKPFTRAELNQLVADGKVTQDAADALYDKQVVERATKEAKEAAGTVVTQREHEAVVTAQLEEYRGLLPEAWETGSKERAKVAKEYRYLVEKLGYPDSKATEVAALRAAFGDPDTIKASRSTGRSGPGETHEEVGGAERTDGGDSSTDGPPKGLAARQKAYYESMISKGHYKDWAAVREELKFAVARAR